MKALKLKTINVRNHKNSFFTLEKETLFTGMNGSGKTTILESLYTLFSLKSFRKQPISSIISFGENFLKIECETVDDDNFTNELSLTYDKGKRISALNGEEIEDIASYIYENPVACHAPDYPGILSKDTQERRNFLDKFIFYSDKSHLEDIKTYNRITAQKISEFEKENIDNDYLEVLDEKIIYLSEKISSKRSGLIKNINERLSEIYGKANFKTEEIFIKYETNIRNKSLLKEEKKQRKQIYGINRDKINMALKNTVIEKFSSTGQKKTFGLLSLFSFIKNVEENRKINIIALLDDFEAALDIKRSSFLKEIFSDNRQVLYTGVDNSRLGFKNVIELN